VISRLFFQGLTPKLAITDCQIIFYSFVVYFIKFLRKKYDKYNNYINKNCRINPGLVAINTWVSYLILLKNKFDLVNRFNKIFTLSTVFIFHSFDYIYKYYIIVCSVFTYIIN